MSLDEVLEAMAESVGFEPTVGVNPHTRSRRAPSTTRPTLQGIKLYQIFHYSFFNLFKMLSKIISSSFEGALMISFFSLL